MNGFNINQVVFNLIFSGVGGLILFYIRSIGTTLNDLRAMDTKLQEEVNSIKVNYVTSQNLETMFRLFLEPIKEDLQEIKAELKLKQDKPGA